MATSTSADPAIYMFCKEIEKDDRVSSVFVDHWPPYAKDEYGITVLLPDNWQVHFRADKLAEAKRYINDNISRWYKQARKGRP